MADLWEKKMEARKQWKKELGILKEEGSQWWLRASRARSQRHQGHSQVAELRKVVDVQPLSLTRVL